MSSYEIRQVVGEEMLAAIYPHMNYAFHASPPFPDREEWNALVRHREGVTCYAAFDGERSVACAESTVMTENVRGALLEMGAVWGVATHPTARRQGLARQLLARLLASMRDAGEAVSGLYPFRESFYERLGWVTFPQLREADFDPEVLASLLTLDLGGEVELMTIGEGLETYRDVTSRLQRSTHGMALIKALTIAPSRRESSWLAVARVAGEPVGVMVYSLKGEEVADFTMRVGRFLAVTSQARYLLLAWIARHIGQASRVEMLLGPNERPETWLADLKPQIRTAHVAPMGRVVDVAGLGGLRVGPGRFTVRLTDPACPWNEGAWRFESSYGGLAVKAADAGTVVDGELTIQAVSALVYGAHDPGDFVFRGWGVVSPEALQEMRSMFPPALAYMHEMY